MFSTSLSPEEIPEALREVTAWEKDGRLTAEEADAWRMRLAAWYGRASLDGAAAEDPASAPGLEPPDSDAA